MSKNYDIIELSSIAIVAARKAGDVILSFYKTDIETDFKTDGSPLTLADKAAHETIVAILADTGIPIVSEEANEHVFESEYYWLVDPLDGTKDFLDGNDEFTVNIALIKGVKTIMGVVFAPALDEMYVGAKGHFLKKIISGENIEAERKDRSIDLSMAISRFHDHPGTVLFAAQNKIVRIKPIGSALKFGRMAFGEVDIYPRLVGTSEWDTAAGQAVLEAADGSVVDWYTQKPLIYGKPTRRNELFIAFRFPYCPTNFIISSKYIYTKV